jgi:cysteine-rich repeat protein
MIKITGITGFILFLSSILTLNGSICGNGYFEPQKEECDDGNLKNGDGCSKECRVERTSIVH